MEERDNYAREVKINMYSLVKRVGDGYDGMMMLC